MYEAGNGYEIRIHKVEPMLVIGREQTPKGFTVHVNSVHEINCEKICLVE